MVGGFMVVSWLWWSLKDKCAHVWNERCPEGFQARPHLTQVHLDPPDGVRRTGSLQHRTALLHPNAGWLRHRSGQGILQRDWSL